MSLETLLEAANFLELRNQSTVKARAKEAAEFHPYAKSAPSIISTSRVRQNSVNSIGDGDWGSETEEDVEKRRSGGAGTREVHNKLEKNRRAHLKECFEMLRQQVPNLEDHKTSNLSILRSAQRCIQNMKRHALDLKQERERLRQQNTQELIKIGELRHELAELNIEIDINNFMPRPGDDSDTDSTATACTDSPILSDVEMEPVPDLDVTPKTAQCTMSSGSKPMQLSSTSSKVVMPSGVKIMPQMTKIVVPVAPPVASAANPRIPTLVPRPQQMPRVNPVAVTVVSGVTASGVMVPCNTMRAKLKTSTTHIRPQTVAQKALQQHIQQQQLKAQLQQQQQQQQQQLQLALQQQNIRQTTLQQAPQQVHMIASMFNDALEHKELLDLGKGLLKLMLKLDKPIGPLTSVRPIVLVPALGKTLSLIVLSRIALKVDGYLSPLQSGFRCGRIARLT
ncbi:hypothetical protein LSAT2_025907 [Lamellibrachia satsuma]|nr:hypothetical protein LSAT2_025907 [Lamellibrachia satsuma]